MDNAQRIQGKRFVLLVIALGLAVMIVASFVFRLQRPGMKTSAPSAMQQADSQQNAQIQVYMERLKKNPQDAEALSGLGDLFMSSGAMDKAAVFWERFLRLRPKDEKGLYHYAVALVQLKRSAEAVPVFETIIQLYPKNYHSYYYLGMISLHELNDKNLARKYLQKVLDINPDHKELVDAVRQELSKI